MNYFNNNFRTHCISKCVIIYKYDNLIYIHILLSTYLINFVVLKKYCSG